jgi:haloalkane dehalogenase
VIAPDLLGQGATEVPRGRLGYSRYAAHLAAFLDEVPPPRFDLVVHDLGGPLGLGWAVRHPERVRRLVILSTTITAKARWAALMAASFAATLAGGPAAVRRVIQLLARRPGAIPPDTAERWGRPWTRTRVLRSLDHVSPAPLVGLAAGMNALRATPELLVWGERDEVFPPRYAEPFLAALPGAELRLVPRAGHWSMMDAPEVVGGHVAAFLRAG